jgi:hypothetical protein
VFDEFLPENHEHKSGKLWAFVVNRSVDMENPTDIIREILDWICNWNPNPFPPCYRNTYRQDHFKVKPERTPHRGAGTRSYSDLFYYSQSPDHAFIVGTHRHRVYYLAEHITFRHLPLEDSDDENIPIGAQKRGPDDYPGASRAPKSSSEASRASAATSAAASSRT